MARRIAIILFSFSIASAIFLVSVLRSAETKRVFSQSSPPSDQEEIEEVEINYYLPYPGRILPDHFLWPVKVFRDKLWLFITVDAVKKGEILLLFSDKRLVSAKDLLKKDKPELAITTLTKAEKYLEQAVDQEELARGKGGETGSLLEKLSLATLKHRQVIEEILTFAPEDARPIVVATCDYPKRLFNEVKTSLMKLGLPFPKNPFED
jgi:hypothetical protein